MIALRQNFIAPTFCAENFSLARQCQRRGLIEKFRKQNRPNRKFRRTDYIKGVNVIVRREEP